MDGTRTIRNKFDSIRVHTLAWGLVFSSMLVIVIATASRIDWHGCDHKRACAASARDRCSFSLSYSFSSLGVFPAEIERKMNGRIRSNGEARAEEGSLCYRKKCEGP